MKNRIRQNLQRHKKWKSLNLKDFRFNFAVNAEKMEEICPLGERKELKCLAVYLEKKRKENREGYLNTTACTLGPWCSMVVGIQNL